MIRRSASIAAALLGAGVLAIGAAGCGDSSTPAAAPGTTTAIETVTAAAPATTAPSAAPATTAPAAAPAAAAPAAPAAAAAGEAAGAAAAKAGLSEAKKECLAHNPYKSECDHIP